MNRQRDKDPLLEEELPDPNEPFLARFHRRKLAARQAEQEPAAPAGPANPEAAAETLEAEPEPLTDADMPPIESLSYESDFTGFLSPKVSEGLRRMALRKLFHSTQFNVVDGLDEYAEDFTTFEALGDIITADMRHQMEVAKRKAEQALQALEERQADGQVAATEPTEEPAETTAEGAPGAAGAAEAADEENEPAEPAPRVHRKLARVSDRGSSHRGQADSGEQTDWDDDAEDV